MADEVKFNPPVNLIADNVNAASLNYENSEDAISCFDATMKAKAIIRDYFLNRITLSDMKERLLNLKKKLPIDYQEDFRRWYNAYFSRYVAAIGISLSFLLKKSSSKFYSALSYQLPITFGDEEDTFDFYQAITKRVKKATMEITNKPISNNGLFGQAEVDAMRRRQEAQIEAIAASGNNLVLVSSHADCSILCQPYQGRLYSLDGTSGIASDGRSYTPLADAVGSTKLMHRYCKHTFLPYKPNVAAPVFSKEEMDAEAEITATQRQMERKGRYLFDRWISWDGIDSRKATEYRDKYNDVVDEYIKWCGENGRKPWLNRI